VIAEEKSKAVSLSIKENLLEIYTSNPLMGEGKETIPINYEGETIKFGFNASYLIDILNAITVDKVTVKIKDKDSAIIIVPLESKEYTCILMPMDIKD
jgi:DNA polymerase-3 subunit beta